MDTLMFRRPKFAHSLGKRIMCVLSCFSHVQLFGPHGLQLARLLCPWDSPGKNTVVGCHAFLQGIFTTQKLNSSSLMSPALGNVFFTTDATWEAPKRIIDANILLQIIKSKSNPKLDMIRLILGFPGGSVGKESTCNAEDLGSNPGLRRSPGEGNGYPLQYFGLVNSMDFIVHGVTKTWT